MPLAPFFNLQFYGPASAAAVLSEPAGAIIAGIKGYGRSTGAISGVATITNADATRLKNSPATIVASASITQALPKGRARPTATIKVNTLSQDDVSGAVLDAKIDGGLSLRESVRLMNAVLHGKTDITGSVVTFRDAADTKDRVIATMTGSERTTVTRDAT